MINPVSQPSEKAGEVFVTTGLACPNIPTCVGCVGCSATGGFNVVAKDSKAVLELEAVLASNKSRTIEFLLMYLLRVLNIYHFTLSDQ